MEERVRKRSRLKVTRFSMFLDGPAAARIEAIQARLSTASSMVLARECGDGGRCLNNTELTCASQKRAM